MNAYISSPGQSDEISALKAEITRLMGHIAELKYVVFVKSEQITSLERDNRDLRKWFRHKEVRKLIEDSANCSDDDFEKDYD